MKLNWHMRKRILALQIVAVLTTAACGDKEPKTAVNPPGKPAPE